MVKIKIFALNTVTALIIVAMTFKLSAKQFVLVDEQNKANQLLTQLGPEGLNWYSPVDYYNNGNMYFRYEVVQKKNNNKVCAQLCMWQPSLKWKETCTDGPCFTSKNVYYHRSNKKINHLWCSSRGCPDYTKEMEWIKMVHKPKTFGTDKWVGGVTFKLTVIVTAGGDKLVCPDDWDCPDAWGAISGGTGINDALRNNKSSDIIQPVLYDSQNKIIMILDNSMIRKGASIDFFDLRGALLSSYQLNRKEKCVKLNKTTRLALSPGTYAVKINCEGFERLLTVTVNP